MAERRKVARKLVPLLRSVPHADTQRSIIVNYRISPGEFFTDKHTHTIHTKDNRSRKISSGTLPPSLHSSLLPPNDPTATIRPLFPELG